MADSKSGKLVNKYQASSSCLPRYTANYQIAIFNSCDGLGLARELQDLQIPQIIVMREPVPDLVAQKFLKYFLEVFSSGQSIYAAVRTARQRLKGIEKEYPSASWLPVISEHPTVVPITWLKSRWFFNTPASKVY